jgi:hypothetical protein
VLQAVQDLAGVVKLRGLILDLRHNGGGDPAEVSRLLGAFTLINGIGVAPDYYLPLTAQDLSTGHDPDITKALTLLGG